ncbi:hypothetical protein ACIQXI_04715 [Lysinibacillus sp. NPDC097195]|uniref:hypothetical protein n=1 Tax=Lysinibacillus sp. NPDC097195 TaxID=3364141 RepID=UPI0038193283
MKKITLLIMLLVVVISSYQMKDKIFVSTTSSQKNIEEFFGNKDIYNTAQAKYGIYIWE